MRLLWSRHKRSKAAEKQDITATSSSHFSLPAVPHAQTSPAQVALREGQEGQAQGDGQHPEGAVATELVGKRTQALSNNRGRWGRVREKPREETEAERTRRAAEEEDEEDLRVLLAASHLQGETCNQTAFASGASATAKGKKERKREEERKNRREVRLEKREKKKERAQRKIDREIHKEREKQEKRKSRDRGHARSPSDGAVSVASSSSSSASLTMITTASDRATRKRSLPLNSWLRSWTCLRRTKSADESLGQLGQSSSRAANGYTSSQFVDNPRKKVCDRRGRAPHERHESDDDPDKKSGPGKVVEEGTVGSCGEEAESWSEEAVEWCGVRYAKGDLPPFDTTGLRDKMAYNPNHSLWLATAAALAYRSPAQIRHVVTRIWQWEDMEFFHNAETDTQGFGMCGEECIVICFRGTESGRDWSTNMHISEVEPFPDLPGVKVHSGFNAALYSVLDQVVDFIDKARSAHPTHPLYITGHSLGGALANLCLAYLVFPSPYHLAAPRKQEEEEKEKGKLRDDDYDGDIGSSAGCRDDYNQKLLANLKGSMQPVTGVYTFGQPKVGDEQFAYELRGHSAGTVFFRLTNNNDIVPFVPRRIYVHCGTRIFLSEAGHIVQGDEAARPAREFWRENNAGRQLFKRKRQGLRDHLVKSYVAFIREHYRLNEAILLSPLRKDMPLLRFHDTERAKLSCEEMRKLVSFDSVIEGLKNMTMSDLMDTRTLSMTSKERKREAQDLGRKWLREDMWEKLRDSEEQQIKKVYKILKGEVEKKKAKLRGDSHVSTSSRENEKSTENIHSSSPSSLPREGESTN